MPVYFIAGFFSRNMRFLRVQKNAGNMQNLSKYAPKYAHEILYFMAPTKHFKVPRIKSNNNFGKMDLLVQAVLKYKSFGSGFTESESRKHAQLNVAYFCWIGN